MFRRCGAVGPVSVGAVSHEVLKRNRADSRGRRSHWSVRSSRYLLTAATPVARSALELGSCHGRRSHFILGISGRCRSCAAPMPLSQRPGRREKRKEELQQYQVLASKHSEVHKFGYITSCPHSRTRNHECDTRQGCYYQARCSSDCKNQAKFRELRPASFRR